MTQTARVIAPYAGMTDEECRERIELEVQARDFIENVVVDNFEKLATRYFITPKVHMKIERNGNTLQYSTTEEGSTIPRIINPKFTMDIVHRAYLLAREYGLASKVEYQGFRTSYEFWYGTK